MLNIVCDRCAFDIDLNNIFKSIINSFLNCIRNFFCFTKPKANESMLDRKSVV